MSEGIRVTREGDRRISHTSDLRITHTTYCRPYGDTEFPYGSPLRLYCTGEASTLLAWIIEVDWDGDGAYDGSNENEYAVDLRVRRGRTDYIKMSSGEATGFENVKIGTLSVSLDNTSGRFDPRNSLSPLYGDILPGRFIRVRVVYNGVTYPVFHGKITNIVPKGGLNPTVRIEAEDGLRQLNNSESDLAITQNVDIDNAISLILDDVNYPTLLGRNIEDSADTLSYFWASGKSLNTINELAAAELGTFFVAADGNATFYSRHHSNSPVLTLTQSEILREIGQPQPWEVVRNYIKVIAHPITARATADIWTLADVPSLAPAASIDIWATYQYNNITLPAINVLTPVITTDYLFNAAADGSGANLSSDLSVSLYDFGTTAKLTITNNGASNGYITLMKVRGDILDNTQPSKLIESSSDSEDTYGRAIFTLDSDWLQNTELANDFSNWLVSFLPTPQIFLDADLDARPSYQFTPDLFDTISLTVSKLGISQNFKVGYIEHKWAVANGQRVTTNWKLEPFTDTAGYWIFDPITGNVTMGVNTVFGL